MDPIELIKIFQLQFHPEGGYYKETYRSKGIIEKDNQEGQFPSGRNYSTAIYFLIEAPVFSTFHKIKSDELWHFYAGDALEVIEIDTEGNLITTHIGCDYKNRQTFQYTVKAGHWFASRVLKGGKFSFVGCTVAPGFDFSDFEMAKRDLLIRNYPQHTEIITELTR